MKLYQLQRMRSGRNVGTKILTMGSNTRPADYQVARLLLLFNRKEVRRKDT
jgi:hypothetical protein